MALQQDIKIEEFDLDLTNAYFRLSEFVWKGGYHADITLSVWVDREAAITGKQAIKRLFYQMPIPTDEIDNEITVSYNQVRSLVYTWLKANFFTEAIDV